MTVFTKPKLICLLLHQSGWEDYEDGDEGIQYCMYCTSKAGATSAPQTKRSFYYPSHRNHYPVYK